MEANSIRGRVISGAPSPSGEAAGEKDNKTDKKSRGCKRLGGLPGRVRLKAPSFKALLRDMRGVVRGRSRKFAAVTAGALVCAACVGALSTYCTVGIDYYYGDKLLCTVAAADDSAAIIGAASQRADLLGVDEPEIEVSAKLALKKNIVDGDEAVDAILAASPELCRGYVLSAEGKTLLTASSRDEIDKALEEYVGKFAMDENSHLSAGVNIEEQIVRRDEVAAAGDMEGLLEAGGVLTVVDTVSEVESGPIPFETTQIPDDSMYMGDAEVVTPGVDGTVETTVESVYCNGELLSSAILDTETTLEPVNQVVKVGTKPRNALLDGFSCPVSGYTLTSGFGPRWGRQHQGIDMAVPSGTEVSAAAAGTVILAQTGSTGYGNYIKIDHGYGIVTTYAHLSSISVEVGQTVERGQLIAYSGNTGNTTGPHLHFEVIDNGTHVNPLEHLI